MGLDVFVMPISGYLAGSFESPLANILGKEAAAKVRRVGNPKPDAPRETADGHVRWIQEELTRLAERPIRWRDSGAAVFSHQFHYAGIQSIRAFAASLDHPDAARDGDGRPLEPMDASFNMDHPRLRQVYRGTQTRFPHLIQHADNQGYYVPCDFPEPLKLGLSPGQRATREAEDAAEEAWREQERIRRAPSVTGPADCGTG